MNGRDRSAAPDPASAGGWPPALGEYAAVVLAGTGLDLPAAAAIAAGAAEPAPAAELPADAVAALRAGWRTL